MNAQLGSYPSYIWRGIWSARRVVEEGGGGEWAVAPLLICGETHGCLDLEMGQSRADMVNSLFDSDQARRVLSIPLSRFNQEDEFLWQRDNTGEYLVRSGYKWLVSNTGDGTECANTSQNNELRVFYNRIWNLKLANKIKITFWRIANNFLPTLSNLVARRVATSSWCPVCSDAEETVEHLFCDCAVITQVLNAVLVPFAPSNNTNNWKLWLVKEFVNSSLDSILGSLV
ncbi:hypothetical protein J1N35_021608 [Gossypium stocksii]|uniref:Reverse transcriptase zinc-binding domain-containing protein n=1 Tax=Gossypium stocksii TaxID=47602 RepID=A0A9D4A202_9ROSI|nr:hypothetical protein J1N35_021608 [Gossypium stocksii]